MGLECTPGFFQFLGSSSLAVSITVGVVLRARVHGLDRFNVGVTVTPDGVYELNKAPDGTTI